MKPILKPFRDRDIYIEWSSIADAPTRIVFSRDNARRYLDVDETRLDRIDLNGSSVSSGVGGGWGWWDDAGIIWNQRWLPRENLYLLTVAELDQDRDECMRLTQEFVDENPVPNP